jgi:fucose permease
MSKPASVVLALAYLAFISLGLPDTVLGVAWPSLRADFGISQSAMGVVLGAGMSGYFLSGLWAGSAVAKLGVGGLLALSSALVSIALFGYALAPSWVFFFPMGAILGLGSGAIDSGLNGYAARHFSVRQLNWLHGCWGIGASVGPALMTAAIAEGYGFRSGYALIASALGAMALLFSITRRRWGEPLAALRGGPGGAAGDSPAGGATAKPKSEPAGFRVALSSSRVWLQMLIFVLYTGVEATVGQWCFSWLRERRGWPIEAAGSWTSAYWASLTIGRLALGGIVDRFGPDRMLRCSTVGALLGVSLFATSAGPLGSVGLLLLGVSLAPMFPTLMARTPARVGDAVAHHAVGFQVSAATLGSTLVPALVGVIVARAGLGAVGIVAVGAALALLFAHEALLAVTRRAHAAA